MFCEPVVVNRAQSRFQWEEAVGWQRGCWLPHEAPFGTGGRVWQKKVGGQREIRCFTGRRCSALQGTGMPGLSHVYRPVKGIVKEVNRKARGGPPESCSFSALCSIFLLFFLQLIYKPCQVFISGLFGGFFLPLHSRTRNISVKEPLCLCVVGNEENGE